MTNIATNIHLIEERISKICASCGRKPSDIVLLAVTKTQPAPVVRQAWKAGLGAFGENYVQEGVEKIAAFAQLAQACPSGAPAPAPPVLWHFIGALQSNKTALVARHFDWVHSIGGLKTARRLSEQRPAALPDLDVCIQVNIDGGPSKSGVAPQQAQELASSVALLPRLRLRGIMTMPDPAPPARTRAHHARARALFESLRERGLALDTLSMGMSGDLESAIAEGATLVRIGTAIFGQRSRASSL